MIIIVISPQRVNPSGSQQTNDVDPMLFYCWASVADIKTTSGQHPVHLSARRPSQISVGFTYLRSNTTRSDRGAHVYLHNRLKTLFRGWFNVGPVSQLMTQQSTSNWTMCCVCLIHTLSTWHYPLYIRSPTSQYSVTDSVIITRRSHSRLVTKTSNGGFILFYFRKL